MRTRSKKLLLILLGICYWMTLKAQDELAAITADSLLSNVVRIEVEMESGWGSQDGFGFVTSEKEDSLYLVTAAHVIYNIDEADSTVIAGPKKISISFVSGDTLEARQITIFPNDDLALLKIRKPDNYFWDNRYLAASLDKRDNLRYIGRSGVFDVLNGGELLRREGFNLIFESTSILPGTSGAPLINEKGIVGMILKASAEEGRALSVRAIKDLLESGNPEYFGGMEKLDLPSSNKPIVLNDDFVWVLGGSFDMGDQFGGGEADEQFKHSVRLRSFMMSPTEVSNLEFAEFLNAKESLIQTKRKWYDWDASYTKIKKKGNQFRVKPGGENHPVVGVNWYGALQYCNWKSEQARLQPVYLIDDDNSVIVNWSANGYRLPTEAEWEYAARERGLKKRFANGKGLAIDSTMNFDASADFQQNYSRIGEYRGTTDLVNNNATKNKLGLHHMSGNVWEWCWDWYDSDYYGADNNNSDPTGPTYGRERVVRGGSWYTGPFDCRASSRGRFDPADQADDRGFRLVRNAK